MTSRVGLMGGTFDPIHIGHLLVASEVSARFKLDRVLFVPTGAPWQKQDRPVSDPEDRYAMTDLATAADPRFEASRVDIDRRGPTYTVDTLREVRAQQGFGCELFFITGADALASISTWRDVGAMAGLAHFVGVSRPGHDLIDPNAASSLAVSVSLMEIPGLAISSSEIRRRVRAGEPIDYLVPQPVVDYIHEHRLYLDDNS